MLWFEHDLHDQLQLIQILARIAEHPGRWAARLITLDSYPGDPRFAGLGELDAEELAALWPSRQPIDEATFLAAARAYEASGTRSARARCDLEQPPPGLPYLAAAFGRLLEERPWVGAGLGRNERQILRAVASGARTPAAVFCATARMEEAPYLGDRGSSAASTTWRAGSARCCRSPTSGLP